MLQLTKIRVIFGMFKRVELSGERIFENRAIGNMCIHVSFLIGHRGLLIYFSMLDVFYHTSILCIAVTRDTGEGTWKKVPFLPFL